MFTSSTFVSNRITKGADNYKYLTAQMSRKIFVAGFLMTVTVYKVKSWSILGAGYLNVEVKKAENSHVNIKLNTEFSTYVKCANGQK